METGDYFPDPDPSICVVYIMIENGLCREAWWTSGQGAGLLNYALMQAT